MKKISVISAVYNEEGNVTEVYNQIKEVFGKLSDNYEYEHIFMDNGSTDQTATILKEVAAKDKNVKVLIYSRNFGPLPSTLTGYRAASGDAVICYEGNLKDPPDMIPTFIKEWEDGWDVVYGTRSRTQDGIIIGILRRAFYKFMNFMSKDDLPLNAGGFRIVDRKVVDELAKLDDYKPYVRGLIASIGFKQKGIEYMRRVRTSGKSKSNFPHLIDFAINALVSYSITPIRLCTYIGLFLSSASFFVMILYVILKFTIWAPDLPGVAGVIVLVLLFSGVQLFFLGVIGEYVGAIHSQVRQKPFCIIQEKINFE